MLLNPFERRLVSGGLRRLVVRSWDIPRILKLTGDCTGQRVLEIGCGRGFGVEATYDLLKAKVVHAFDTDDAMVALARQLMTRSGYFHATPRARIWQGSATEIPAPDADYDAVLGLQVLHHVQDWRAAVAEIARVLRPGGRVMLSDSLIGFIDHPILGRWMDHPTEDRFTQRQLFEELELRGFHIVGCKGRGKWMTWVVGELQA
jgi:ubiquinone/menaquinone biosynthesis C-methylase UbiE